MGRKKFCFILVAVMVVFIVYNDYQLVQKYPYATLPYASLRHMLGVDLTSLNESNIQEVFHESHSKVHHGIYQSCLTGGEHKEELLKLGKMVKNRIYHLQNPPECHTARKLITSLEHSGYTSQIHRLMLVLMYAYASNRTLVFVDRNWWFSEGGRNKWEDFHMPLSDTCNDTRGQTEAFWNPKRDQEHIQVLKCWDCIESITPKPKKVKAIPVDIASVLVKYHMRPLHWWAGQFVSYIMRLRPWLEKYIESMKLQMPNMKHPLASVHVRTTDKVSTHDSDRFSINDYFQKVEWFSQNLNSKDLAVYVATDNLSVLSELSPKYKKIDLSFSANNSEFAFQLKNRYNRNSIVSIISDVVLLSFADILIGTFSSNVGRVAYELMQARQGDISHCVHSLDSEYWFFKFYEPHKIAIQGNVLTITSFSNELELKTGDMIYINRKGRKAPDGYSRGTNMRTKTQGIYPLDKAVDYIFTYVPPDYSHFDVKLYQQ